MSDPCCPLCKGAYGICLSRYGCEHHRVADAQDEANHRATRTIRDPTASRAIANVMKERKR